MARVQGFTDYRYAVITHPISSLNAEQVRERAAQALPQVLLVLGLDASAAEPSSLGSDERGVAVGAAVADE